MDFNEIIRIRPQLNNALHGERSSGSGRGDGIGFGTGRRLEGFDHFSAEPALQEDHQLHHNSVPTNNLQDPSTHYVSHLYAEKYAEKGPSAAESRALDEKLSRGTWETALVFGMICAAIICSMGSVIWFIRSYRSINSAHEETIRRITTDEDSSDSSSSISYDAGSVGPTESWSGSLGHTTSEVDVDVELDFEFSEEINPSAPPNEEVTLNISSQNFSYA